MAHLEPAGLSIPTVTDNQTIGVSDNGISSELQDRVSYNNASNATFRSYTIAITVTLPMAGMWYNLSTQPVLQWGHPDRIPNGEDVLPPLVNWTLRVSFDNNLDTANWSVNASSAEISRYCPWQNATVVVSGFDGFTDAVAVDDVAYDGSHVTAVGVQGYDGGNFKHMLAHNPTYTPLLQNLTPELIRWSVDTSVPTTWNNVTGQPTFNLATLALEINTTRKINSTSMVDIPAGTWGDGNTLPTGMPVNTSVLLTGKGGTSGYFPTLAAYKSYLTVLLADVARDGLVVKYWNVGNEVPARSNLTQAAAFSALFNLAAGVIHNASPTALVSSDVLESPGDITYYASHIAGANFLEFHYYPEDGACPWANYTVFCPPGPTTGGYIDEGHILANSADFQHGVWSDPPPETQSLWHNGSGQWLPVLDTETNLDAFPNGYLKENNSFNYGTDPRQETLFAAAWFDSELVDGSENNLSELTPYAFETTPQNGTITFPYGGFGYALAAQGAKGGPTIYAPYWALLLWQENFPSGAAGLQTNTSASNLTRSYAVLDGRGVNVLLVNRAAVATTFHVITSGRLLVARSYTVLDSTTYRQVYNPRTNMTSVQISGLQTVSLHNATDPYVTIAGYGVAVVRFAYGNATGSTSGGTSPMGTVLLPRTPCATLPTGLSHSCAGSTSVSTEPHLSASAVPTVPSAQFPSLPPSAVGTSLGERIARERRSLRAEPTRADRSGFGA